MCASLIHITTPVFVPFTIFSHKDVFRHLQEWHFRVPLVLLNNQTISRSIPDTAANLWTPNLEMLCCALPYNWLICSIVLIFPDARSIVYYWSNTVAMQLCKNKSHFRTFIIIIKKGSYYWQNVNCLRNDQDMYWKIHQDSHMYYSNPMSYFLYNMQLHFAQPSVF